MAPRSVSVIPRPPEAKFRHLQRSSQDDIAIALAMNAEDFRDFKKTLSEKVQTSLDRTKKLEDQDPAVWCQFMQWARGAMPFLASMYEEFWPVELYVKIKLSKDIASDRHRFRMAMEKHKQKSAFTGIFRRSKTSDSTDEVERPLRDLPPPYEETAGDDCDANEQVHPDAVPEDVEEFLKSCDIDLGHLTNVFVTSRAGLFNMERLKLIARWPAALRRDHLERHFSAVLDDVEIEVLNMRFSGINQARR